MSIDMKTVISNLQEHVKKEEVMNALLPAVEELPTLLEDILPEPANSQNIALARRRFIERCIDLNVEEKMRSRRNPRSRIIERMYEQVVQMNEIIEELADFIFQRQITDREVLVTVLGISPDIVDNLRELSLSDVIESQPTCVCYVPINST